MQRTGLAYTAPAPAWAPSAQRLTRAQRSIASLFFTCGFGFANWSTRIPSLRESLALDGRALGLLLLCTALGSLVSFRLAGGLSQRFGSHAVAFGGTAGFCVLLNAAPAMPGAVAAGAGLWALGFAAGLMDVGMNAQAMQLEQLRGRPILSTLHGVYSIGGLAGAATGTAAAYQGLSLPVHIGAVSLALMALTLWARAGLLSTQPGAPSGGRAGAQPYRPTGALWVLGAVGFCASIGEGAMRSWLGVYLHDNLHVALGPASLGYGSFCVAMVLARLTCDRLCARLQPRQLMRASGLWVGAALLAGLSVNSPWAMMAAAAAVGLGLAPVTPAIFRSGAQLPHVPPARALATLATMSYGGGLFGPPTIGLLADCVGLRAGLGVVAALALAQALLAQVVPNAPEAAAAEAL